MEPWTCIVSVNDLKYHFHDFVVHFGLALTLSLPGFNYPSGNQIGGSDMGEIRSAFMLLLNI